MMAGGLRCPATGRPRREMASRYSTSLETFGSPPPPKNTRGLMSGKYGVLGPRAWLPGNFTSKRSCSEGGTVQEINDDDDTACTNMSDCWKQIVGAIGN